MTRQNLHVLELSDRDRNELQQLANQKNTLRKIKLRAQIILLSSEGKSNLEISIILGVCSQTVSFWRNKWLSSPSKSSLYIESSNSQVLKLSDSERDELQHLANQDNTPQQIKLRAKIILLAAQGISNREISEILGISYMMVNFWRKRWLSTASLELFSTSQPDPNPNLLKLSDRDRDELERLVNQPYTPKQIKLRGQIILLTSLGKKDYQIAQILGVNHTTVRFWQNRWSSTGSLELLGIKRQAIFKLSECSREQLQHLVNQHHTPEQIKQRASIILLTSEGKSNQEISSILNVSCTTIASWQKKWLSNPSLSLFNTNIYQENPNELTLSDRERHDLQNIVNHENLSQRIKQRASIILLASQGKTNLQISQILGVSHKTAGEWRKKWLSTPSWELLGITQQDIETLKITELH